MQGHVRRVETDLATLLPSSTMQCTDPARQISTCAHARCACSPRTSFDGTPKTEKNRAGTNGRPDPSSTAASEPRRSVAVCTAMSSAPPGRPSAGLVAMAAGAASDCGVGAESAYPTIRAGLPTTIACAGTSRTTTAPAPIMARRPMLTPGRITELAPMEAPGPTTVWANDSGYCFERGNGSLVKVALGPTNTSSPRRTPSHSWTPDFTVTRSPTITSFSMKTWSLMLQSWPRRAPGRTCAKAQMRVPSPTSCDSQMPDGWTKTLTAFPRGRGSSGTGSGQRVAPWCSRRCARRRTRERPSRSAARTWRTTWSA